MSKRNFKNTLAHGTCEVCQTNPGTERKPCYSKDEEGCNCCAECHASCVDFRNTMADLLERNGRIQSSEEQKIKVLVIDDE